MGTPPPAPPVCRQSNRQLGLLLPALSQPHAAATGKCALDLRGVPTQGRRELLQYLHRRRALGPTCLPTLNVRHRDVDKVRQLTWREASHDAHPAETVLISVRGQKLARLHAQSYRQARKHRRAWRRGTELPSRNPFTARNANQSSQLMLREPHSDTSSPQSLWIEGGFLTAHRSHTKRYWGGLFERLGFDGQRQAH